MGSGFAVDAAGVLLHGRVFGGELIVDDEMWTLPKYRELLFIN